MIELYYFDRDEFWRFDGPRYVNWFDRMNQRLLFSIDLLRHRWSDYKRQSTAIRISPAHGAIGRHAGQSETLSDHDVDRWGEVRGIDVMPDGLDSLDDVDAFRRLAIHAGITAIGFYPHWQPAPGFHLGVRDGRWLGDPATWGAVNRDGDQTYMTFSAAREAFA